MEPKGEIMEDLAIQLERAIESKARALKGSDKSWKRETKFEVERIRNIIRKRNLDLKREKGEI